jgi:hypothetical protein
LQQVAAKILVAKVLIEIDVSEHFAGSLTEEGQ